ncbi:Eco57I restriction-modification methylase domain-containing protein [Rhabdothermincola sediminis]|uniref:Eco57I restriction-modification methylase domain-containing protein n=1 Tax=Rhabdothermincola sediminis TaxID=2751370 RepID=UPI001AA05E5E|nr:hypothetical protein [Rhabdothermincola sediminis]
MTGALGQAARSALERFIQRARRLLEEDLARHAEGRFGIHLVDGTIEDEANLHLDPDGLAARRDLVDVLHFLRGEEPDHPAAVARLVREAAFTHLNRLVAIRIAEAIGLLPESLAAGPASAGYRELLEVAPLLAHDASGGYWRYLQLCGDELAADLPQLFDPRNPLLALAPSPAAFDELVELLTAADLAPVWDAPDALGWAYQFFNSGDERRAMRDASASPRSSRELAVRNQFFTPRYVVDFLVHNSLGRRLLDADPSSPMVDDLPLLLDPPTDPGEPVELAEVRVLDPACGSGHFLLGAYDVLERAWHHAGVEPEAAAPHIVASLWGIDIDPRCAQVAAAALIFRARRACRHHELPTPNIICARALPEPAEGWDTLLAGLPEDRRQLVAAMRDALDQAPVLGPLLKVEERLAGEIRARVAGADDTDGTLFAAAGVAEDSFERAEADVLTVLRRIADQTTSTPAERLFAAEANDAIRFVDALRHRYDVVLMNPPFGEPVAVTKPYLKSTYPWAPSKDTNLLALFVGRGLELCKPTGATGAITSRACMFLKTFEDFRTQILVGYRLRTVADLGYGVMEQALVEAAAYVIDARRSRDTDTTTFVRLLKDTDRASALGDAIGHERAGTHDDRVFRVAKHDLTAIPGAPLAYWMGDSIRRLFTDLPPLEGNGAEVRQGLATGDDFRFLRLAWEVDPAKIAHSRDETHAGKRWVPFAKGGEYSPFWSDIHLLVDWANDGESLADFPGSVIRNSQYYFNPGLTWPLRSQAGFNPRLLPGGCIFGHKGPAIFLGADRTLACLGALLSRPAMLSLGAVTTFGAYEVGAVKKVPDLLAAIPESVAIALADAVSIAVETRAAEDRRDEVCLRFESPLSWASGSLMDELGRQFVSVVSGAAEALIGLGEAYAELEEALGIDEGAAEYLESQLGPPFWSDQPGIDAGQGEHAVTPLGPYLLCERLETTARDQNLALDAACSHLTSAAAPEDVLHSGASRYVSWLVGVAFGRWDVRGDGRPVSIDPLAPPPSCAPGMLVAQDGLPVTEVPADYPLDFPLTGVLLDEAGHVADIVQRVEDADALALKDASGWLTEALTLLGSRTLRDYVRKAFFKEHLARYSKSRRKAPIYWPLYVPSGKWGVWVYAPRLTRETLYVVASEALRREGHAEVEIERLERERVAGGGRGAKALDKALDDERKLAEELRRFRQEAERIAGLGWEPDLDDGIVLCAAPLADLFPQWCKELATYRDELRAGKYDWSTVSKWADQL